MVVPRLLLPFIFRRRRSQLLTVREAYQRTMEERPLQQQDGARQAQRAGVGLYSLLIDHVRVCVGD